MIPGNTSQGAKLSLHYLSLGLWLSDEKEIAGGEKNLILNLKRPCRTQTHAKYNPLHQNYWI